MAKILNHSKLGVVKEICPSGVQQIRMIEMDDAEFEARIATWARSRADVEALIQIGSRVQPGNLADVWSDWDYQLIIEDPSNYLHLSWLSEIGVCLSSHVELTERKVHKVSAIFEGGLEVDFVLLAAWQVRLVYWAMANHTFGPLFPAKLVQGIANTQLIVAPGYRVIVGGSPWEERLEALQFKWPQARYPREAIKELVSGFWRHAVWVQKKISRGELRAAQRWLHREVVERRWAILEYEARAQGLNPRPEARKAEQWLSGRRLAQTELTTKADRRILAGALLCEMELFEEASAIVAQSHGVVLQDYSAVARWLRELLTPLARDN